MFEQFLRNLVKASNESPHPLPSALLLVLAAKKTLEEVDSSRERAEHIRNRDA